MKVNSISPVIEVTIPSGEKQYRLVRLLSKTSPHKANLSQDYNKIQQAALDQKKNGALIGWVGQKCTSTFVKVDTRYNSCPNLGKWSYVKPRP
ncbi:MAG: hypothetical protein U5L45_21020 [Saprospiraceae bacterium]|nr:hypothetical protein [Saprospiraceae bacterium]